MTRKIVKQLKEQNQDFEFYPTTEEIISEIYYYLKDSRERAYDILDVGCGNAKFLLKFQEWSKRDKPNSSSCLINNYYAIEKSDFLIKNLPPEVIIVGTDFWQNTLIDKKVDIIYSNPPYSEYEAWAEKIIMEAYAHSVFLVIPERWENSDKIKNAIKLRGFDFQILGKFDFLNSEDRKARAKVDLVKINLTQYYGKESDPFESWFNKEFKFDCVKENKSSYEENLEIKEKLKNQLVKSGNLVETLSKLYRNDLSNLTENYKKIQELDFNLLKELGVSVEQLSKSFKMKIENLKRLYWQELFNSLDKITRRLTSKKRKIILDKLNLNTSIDFTESNIYAIVIWVIKNANQYFDEQLLEVYYDLTRKENIKNYKSNKKTWIEDRWRYSNKDHSHYCLDYRLVYQAFACWGEYGFNLDKFSPQSAPIIDDLVTIANNLGFEIYDYGHILDKVKAGQKFELFLKNNELFAEIKIYKNNNIHLKLNKKFMMAFNIEAARLNKWLKSPKEVAEEFPEEFKVSEKEASQFFRSNTRIIFNNISNLLSC